MRPLRLRMPLHEVGAFAQASLGRVVRDRRRLFVERVTVTRASGGPPPSDLAEVEVRLKELPADVANVAGQFETTEWGWPLPHA